MGNQGQKKKNGFTLIEMIISMTMLVIMSTALAGTFSSGFSTYGSSRELQRNLETAQYALNTLEKLLRTSTLVETLDGSRQSIIFYEYSSGNCFQYRIQGNALQARKYPEIFANCSGVGFGVGASFSNVTSGYVTGNFSVTNSVPTSGSKTMGRVTLNLAVKKDSASAQEARIQATASLRDYSYVGY
jgi:prepilin-type N-terminal cleavage/methylation domain-containing protein